MGSHQEAADQQLTNCELKAMLFSMDFGVGEQEVKCVLTIAVPTVMRSAWIFGPAGATTVGKKNKMIQSKQK